jgi:flavorubredoxin
MRSEGDRLPRELGSGLFWCGSCEHFPFRGETIHSGNNLYLIVGEDASMLIEAGSPNDHRVTFEQLDELLVDAPPLRYIYPTHQETPHAGSLLRFLHRYPDVTVRGNIKDYHLFFPEFEDRFVSLAPGEEINLGGTTFQAIEAIIRDLKTTQWGFDTRSRALFPGDGFAYGHEHLVEQCGHLAEEVSELDIPDMTGVFTDQSLTWARYTDMEPYTRRLEDLITQRDVRVVGPTHGLPTMDVPSVLPRIVEGLRKSGGHGERYQGEPLSAPKIAL